MKKDYLLFNPETGEIRGPVNASPSQIHFNTEGGAFAIFEMDASEGWRTVEIVKDDKGAPVGLTERFNFDLLRNPLLRAIDADADAEIAPLIAAGTRGAVYAAKEVEARRKGGARPILAAEAKGMGIATDDLAAQVRAKADAARADAEAIGRIEARRRNAKAAVLAASELVDILRAGIAARA
jgi:hypothetical protein